MSLHITIDNGGTFTDVCLIDNERVIGTKTLTTPYDLTKCFFDVLKTGSKEIYGQENLKKLLSDTDYIRYSTTAGTNAIVQKKGPRLGLILSEGASVKKLTENEDEFHMFGAMVDDRVCFINPDEEDLLEQQVIDVVNSLLSQGANRLVVSLSGQNLVESERKIRNLILRKYPRHLLGSVPILFSHEVVEDTNDKRRTWTAVINSFLHPGMERFLYNTEKDLRSYRAKNPLLIFHNDGNSARVAKTTAIKTYGSGPRGGMEGTKAFAHHYQIPALLTLDIGGTTSDISLIQAERIKEESHGAIEGIKTSFRLGDLISIGAGGSSIFRVKDGEVTVGPDSVGAAPGPACFGRGGKDATITDAYLLMGIFDPDSFFGGKVALDVERAKAAVEENIARPLGVTLEEALLHMEKAYQRKIAQGLSVYQKEVEDVHLLAFGGAGPMSACGVAEESNIDEVIVPRMAAVFSAFGISFSDIAHEYQISLNGSTQSEVNEKIEQLMGRAKRDMFAEGFDLSQCMIETSLCTTNEEDVQFYPLSYLESQSEFINGAKDLQIHLKVVKPLSHFTFEQNKPASQKQPEAIRKQNILQPNGKPVDVPVYVLEDIEPGTAGEGPALIEDPLFTCRVLENWSFTINENKDIFLRNESGENL